MRCDAMGDQSTTVGVGREMEGDSSEGAARVTSYIYIWKVPTSTSRPTRHTVTPYSYTVHQFSDLGLS